MAICCWTFEERCDRDIYLAVKGPKRAGQLADQLLRALPGTRIDLPLVTPPGIRHINGGGPLGPLSAYVSLIIEVTPQPSPELAVEVHEGCVLIATPEVMLPELAGLIADSHQLHTSDEDWIEALIAIESGSINESKLRVWTWDSEGLLTGE